MLAWIRSFIFFIGYVPVTMIYGVFTLMLVVLPARKRHRITILWCSLIVYWMKLVCGVKYTLHGKENLQKVSGPIVVLSKHQSAWETLYLQTLFFPASTILKKELLSIPFFGWGLRALQPIPIDRSNPKKALKEVKSGSLSKLGEGNNVLIFPEGTRMPPGEKGKYARSGADIAITAGVQVIPVAVNAGRYWPMKQFRKFPGLVQVVVGEPIDTHDKTSRELTEEVESWIEGKMAEIGQ